MANGAKSGTSRSKADVCACDHEVGTSRLESWERAW